MKVLFKKKRLWANLTLLTLFVSLLPTSIFVSGFSASETQSEIYEWPMFRHDLNHTGYSASAAPETNNSRWTIQTGGAVKSSPAFANGTVFVGSDDDYVYAINATNGQRIWSYKTGGDVRSSPAVVSDRIFVGSSDHKVHALYLNGTPNWNSTDLGGAVESSPAVAYGLVFVGSGNGTAYALNQTNGRVEWKNTTTPGQPIKSSAAVADGVVYIGSNDRLYAFNATNLNQLWNYSTYDEVWSSPAVVDGVVFFGSKNSRVYALNATANGTKIWEFIAGAGVTSSPAVADGKVFVGSWDHHVYCLNQTDPNGDGTIDSSEVNWTSLDLGGAVESSPAVADGKVFVGSDDGSIYALNASNGTVIWECKTGDKVYSSPAVASTLVGGMVFVGSDDKNISAFGVANEPPEAYFDFSPQTPTIFEQVTFDASASDDPDGLILNYSWDFNNDGIIDNDTKTPTTTYAYKEAGTYQINLTVTDDFVKPAKGWTTRTITVTDIWPMSGHDQRHSGYSNSKAPITNCVNWSYPTDGPIKSSPAVGYGMVFVGSDDGHVYALNETTGEQIWNVSIGGQVKCSPAIEEGVVFVGSEQIVYALNATANGTEIWRYQTTSNINSSLTVADGVVFIATIGGSLVALNKTNKDLIWTFDAIGSFYSSPAVTNGTVFIGSTNFTIYALPEKDPNSDKTIDSSEVKWSYPTGGPIYSSPSVSDNMVFVGSNDKHIYALPQIDPNGDKVISPEEVNWNYTTNGSIKSSPAVGYGMVFVGSYDNYVYALDQINGRLVWKYKTGGPVESSPAIAKADGRNMVFVGSKNDSVYALSKDGGLYWSYETGGDVDSSPAIADETVFIGSDDGTIYAFRDPPNYSVHDVSVIHRVGNAEPYVFEQCKSVVGQNYTAYIYIMVENQGSLNESFSVTLYANATEIETLLVDNMPNASSRILKFTWNTTGFAMGNYTISAYALPVSEETDTPDNTLEDDIVYLRVPGDVNADNFVELQDFFVLSSHFGCIPPGSRHLDDANEYAKCFNADINADGMIELMDFFIASSHFGEHYP